jgi:hypothetical protein
MSQLGKKLQLKQGQHILLLNAPASVLQLLSEEGYTLTTKLTDDQTPDAIQLFVHNKTELASFAPQAIVKLNKKGVLWIAYPKKSSGIVSDLTRDKGWEAIFEMGYAGVRQVAINEVWSSLRFKHSSERKVPSRLSDEYPGIEKESRIVTPPTDLQAALDSEGLSEKFQAMSFTCKKEYVVAVLDAKRAETRANRIIKTIEQVAAM